MEHAEFDTLIKGQVKYWQDLLRLKDWDITVDYWPHAALDSDVGRVLHSRNQKTATLALRVPEDIPPIERDWPEHEATDYDVTIVHELLHLKCVDLESPVEWAEEQLANHLARALVTLYRMGGTAVDAIVPGGTSTTSSPVIGQSHGHYL